MFARLVDRCVQAGVEIDESVRRPQALAKLVAGDDLSGIFDEDGQHLEWALLELHHHTLPSQLARNQIEFEEAEADLLARTHVRARHIVLRVGKEAI